ncbi:MAG TPA: redox-sensing transcriptional repressor Rex [Bacteroidales bacterium]|nr:redox-sensing transcriptional repressor Rex [Bacteroidales bacterium]
MKLPEKTIERLSQYRRTLLNCLHSGQTHIFSHELAALLNITAVQVRRDIMFLGYTSIQRKGYDIQEMVNVIGNLLDSKEVMNVAVIGIGHLGTAITTYFKGKRAKLDIVASFDVDPEKIGKMIAGVKCYSITQASEVVKDLNISVGIVTLPPEHAAEVVEKFVHAGVKGFLNFTTVPLNVPSNVYLEEFDMITSLEKVAYFAKKHK